MGFMTTILEKTVILCAQVYLLVIMLMILGLRWWQMMAMKDFQIWVLATCCVPSMPALEMLDEAISSPSLPALQHSRHSCCRMHDRDLTACPRGIVSLSSPNPSPQSPAVGAGGSTVAAGRWRGWGVPWAALVWLWKSLASLPCLSTASVLIPTQGKTSGCLAEGAQKVKIWSNLQDFGWKICKGCSVHRQPLSHTLSERGKHLLVTWKGVKPSGCVLKGNLIEFSKEGWTGEHSRLFRIQVLPVLIFCLGKMGIVG